LYAITDTRKPAAAVLLCVAVECLEAELRYAYSDIEGQSFPHL
jgi:uncharacterized protein (DUF952 family)